jgi:DNA-binding beta-propeller fold protein YncE
MNKKHKYIWALILTLVICAGCLKQPVDIKQKPKDIFWPNPPETKRIQFLNTINGPRDINIVPGFFTNVFRYLIGKAEPSIVAPYGVALDAQDRLYVVDTFLRGVHVFDAKTNAYNFFPEELETLVSPVDIAIDDTTGVIYVSDSKQGVVKVFQDQGRKQSAEFGNNIFERPTGVAVNPISSELLVVDTLQSRVFRFNLSNLEQKGTFGSVGTAEGQFHFPTNISVSPDGNIIVSDSLNFRVQVFSPEGRFLNTIGFMGQSPGSFSRPKGVAVDSDGNIYVVDALFDNVQIFDKKGVLLLAFGGHGKGYGEFWLPTGIYIDGNDIIYVSDSSNRRVQVFKYLKEDVEQ